MSKTSRNSTRLRVVSGCLALPFSVGRPATHALGQWNAGLVGPSDVSTAQTLEAIRDRRLQVAQSCPVGTMPSASGMCVPTGGTTTPTAAQGAPKAAAKAAPKQTTPAAP